MSSIPLETANPSAKNVKLTDIRTATKSFYRSLLTVNGLNEACVIFSFCIGQKLMPDFALTLRKEAVAMKAAAKCTKWLKFPQRRRANFKPRVGFLLMMNGGLKIAQYGFFCYICS